MGAESLTDSGTALWAPWSLAELAKDLAAGLTTPQTALERAAARIAETEPVVHAWVERYDAPQPGTTRGPLGGVPLGVKDIIDVAGLPTRCGTPLRAGAPPATADAPIVRAWQRAGALTLGKTVTTEFAYFAPGPTTNPANPLHTPGGSSSGSAAAVASGQVPLALGSQTAGSVTRPAAFCGVASLVMTRGRFPADGIAGLSPSLDAHGVFAAAPLDLAVAWAAITGEATPEGRIRPPRILLWRAENLGVVSDDMAAAIELAAEVVSRSGATVDTFGEDGLVGDVTAAHPVVMAREAVQERALELPFLDQLSRPLADLLRSGRLIGDADYRDSVALVHRARARVVDLLSAYDLILGPGAPGAAPEGLAATGDPVLSRAWQALGLPQVAVPGARDGASLPLGIQVVGAPNGEARLLAGADWIHRALMGP